MRRTINCLVVWLAVCIAVATFGQVVVSSFDHNGVLTCSNLEAGTSCDIEWAPSLSGPWTNSWAGQTNVLVDSNGKVMVSVPMFYRVKGIPASSLPSGMALIPAGSFQMGDSFGEGYSDELPVHSMYVGAFYMDKYEVTKSKWDEVANWAINHGYDISASNGFGKAASHPVQEVTWYECVKWCNARSEMEELVPAYYTASVKLTVYRTGDMDVANNWIHWDNSYRLPTESEWEKAARGGFAGRRFPWGDTIQHARASYFSSSSYDYDTSPTRGYHPDYDEGGYPYTSPVGSFLDNGYGVYDMAGNVWEWCNDWMGIYSSGVSNPHGPSSGSYRVLRGGSWSYYAHHCRVADRNNDAPDGSYNFLGFRAVLSPGP